MLKETFKRENGSMAVYTSIVLLTMLIIITAIFITSSLVRATQLQTAIKVKESYEEDNSKVEEIYQSIINKFVDKIAPSATITVSSTDVLMNDSITATIVQEDNNDKLDLSKCKYVYNNTSTYIGNDESNYTGGTLSSANTKITLSSSSAGTYYLHVLTKDTDGNATETISSPVNVISTASTNYSTANSTSNPYYTFTVPANGTYKLQVWGAQGGYRSSSTYGGKGGYSIGNINLTKGTKLYVYVGGEGGYASSVTSGIVTGGYNGGGYRYGYKGGGGATDIRLISGTWNNSSSLLSRIIVAGGGGSDGASNKKGMHGGGSSGGSSTENYTANSNYCGKGGTQTYSGYSTSYTISSQATSGLNSNSTSYYCGGFGFGGGGVYLSSRIWRSRRRRMVRRFWNGTGRICR